MTNVMLFFAVLVMTAVPASGQDQDSQPEAKPEHAFAMKELTDFHDILHPLVHDALPNGDYGTIRSQLDALLAKGKAILRAKLPPSLTPKRKELRKASNDLVKQLRELAAMKVAKDNASLERKFNEMHETFERLAGLAQQH
jgi:hypothetical protein